MKQPTTLLAMAGAASAPPPLDAAVLLLIDCQREYVDGRLPLPGVADALAEAGRLLHLARERGVPVVHVRHRGRAGGLFDPATPAFGIAPEAAPVAGEQIVDKGLPNAFAGTDLKEVLDGLGRKQLIVAGFMTHMCVSSTVRAGLDLGFQSAVIGEACATRDLPDAAGGIVPAEMLHRAELAALADRFAMVLPDAAALAPAAKSKAGRGRS